MIYRQLKYNYVIFATLDINKSEFLHIMYNDLQGYDNISFIDTPFENHSCNELYKTLHKYHFHGYLNKYFQLPLKSLWNKFYYHAEYDSTKKQCFVFFIPSLQSYNETFFLYLRKNYPGCKMVIYLEDIIASRTRNGKNPLRLDFIKKYFDLALSYDKGDCQKYGFLYYPTSYSVFNIDNNPKIANSDLFFCGAAKQRYDTVKEIFSQCSQNHIKCDFIVTRYGNNPKVAGMNYVPYMLPYSNYLEHMIKSNCLLDVIQSGSRGFTVRVWEALVYGKKLLTNNKEILSSPFYDEHQFCYFEHITDREIRFIKQEDHILPRYREELSPIRLLEYIDNKL